MTDERLHKKQNNEGVQTDLPKTGDKSSEKKTVDADAEKAKKSAGKASDKAVQRKSSGTSKKKDAKREKAEREKRTRLMKRRIAASLEREAEAEREALLAGVNPYFIKLSRKVRIAKIASALVLAAFVVVMLASFRDDITPENLRYMFRDMSITGTVYTNTSSVTISYDTDTEAVFSMFRGDIAMANRSRFVLYSSSGSEIFSRKHGYKNPALASSEACVIVYDLGGNSYAVYNSLEKISEQTTAYPISAIAASDGGLYAVMTRSAEYRTVIYIYNSKGENIAQIFKDKLALDIGFDHDGERLFVTSVYNKEGEIRGELSVYSPYSDETVFTAELGSRLPTYSSFTSDGGITVLTDDTLIAYKKDGTQKGQYEYAGYMMRTGEIGEKYTALAFPSLSVSGASDIYLISGTDQLMTVPVEGEIERIRESGGMIYALCSAGVIRVDPDSGETVLLETEGNPCDINVYEDTLFVSYYSHTSTYDLTDAFETESQNSESGTETR